MQNEEALVEVDFDLPNHSNELCDAEEIIEKIKTEFKTILKQKTINGKNHERLFEETIRALDYVGKLSMPCFAIEDELEELYNKRYRHAPQLAKTLWQEHYGKIHHPYNLLKNRCFRLIEELDAEYHEVHKKHPPNWKP